MVLSPPSDACSVERLAPPPDGLLLVEERRHLVGVEFLLVGFRLGRGFLHRLVGFLAVRRLGGLRLRRLRAWPSAPAPLPAASTASASAVSAAIVSLTGSGLTSCFGCGSGVTSVAGTGAGFGSGCFTGSGFGSSTGFGSGFGRRRGRGRRLDRLRLGLGRRRLVGVDAVVADLLRVGHDVGLLGRQRRRLLVDGRLLVALLDLGDLFDRNDVDRQRLDVGDLERARRRQREQAEAEQRRVHDHRCGEAGLHLRYMSSCSCSVTRPILR